MIVGYFIPNFNNQTPKTQMEESRLLVALQKNGFVLEDKLRGGIVVIKI